jgi:hypothetical protein
MSGVLVNPIVTTNAPGSFFASSDGLIQGTAYDDPAFNFALCQGTWGASGAAFGGMAISEFITPSGPTLEPGNASLNLQPATAVGNISGLTVFNQAVAMIASPGSTAPKATLGMSVSYYRTGSNARIAVAMAPSLVSLEGAIISSQVSWDFVGQQLVPYVAAYPANVITAASWSATSGGEATFTTTTAHGVGVGDYFAISGMTPSGYNGVYQALTGTTGSTLIGALVTNPGTATTFGTLVAGGGAFPGRIIEICPSNCLTVSVDPTGTLFNWNPNGACAVVLI